MKSKAVAGVLVRPARDMDRPITFVSCSIAFERSANRKWRSAQLHKVSLSIHSITEQKGVYASMHENSSTRTLSPAPADLATRVGLDPHAFLARDLAQRISLRPHQPPPEPTIWAGEHTSRSYISYAAAARRIARTWCGPPLALSACARDCHTHVARFTPLAGCGVPYQYMISCGRVSAARSRRSRRAHPAVLDGLLVRLLVRGVQRCTAVSRCMRGGRERTHARCRCPRAACCGSTRSTTRARDRPAGAGPPS
jgi:hypothetical protein